MKQFIARDERRDNITKLNQFITQFINRNDSSKPIKSTAEITKYIISQYYTTIEHGFIGDEGKTLNNRVSKLFYTSNFTMNAKSDIHFWEKISDKLNTDSLKFLRSHPKSSYEEKAKLWILIELSNKNLHNTLKSIYENDDLRLCWLEESILRKYYREVYDILIKLKDFNYTIESDVLRAFYEIYPTDACAFYLEKEPKNMKNNEMSKSANIAASKTIDTSTIHANLERFRKMIDPNKLPNANTSNVISTNKNENESYSNIPTDKKDNGFNNSYQNKIDSVDKINKLNIPNPNPIPIPIMVFYYC